MAGYTETARGGAKDRLLRAAADLLGAARGGDVSTRAICEAAGVQAPTLYHHFGSKQGLLDAVVGHGFGEYVQGIGGDGSDPVADLRAGWDAHITYALEHPEFYTLLYGRIEPGQPCGVTSVAEARLVELLDAAAKRGLLRITPADAAARIAAANSGMALKLLGQPEGEADLALSEQVREAMLASVLTSASDETSAAPSGLAAAAVALATELREDGPLTAAETALLRQWLTALTR